MRISAWCSPDERLARLLTDHPLVDFHGTRDSGVSEIEFKQGDWKRRVQVGGHHAEFTGLVELSDNNPIVCADLCSVPPPISTLALIALGPLIRSGILLDDPVIMANHQTDVGELDIWLETAGFAGTVTEVCEEADFDGVFVCNALAHLSVGEPYSAIDDLYEEAFGRSFFVFRSEDSEWDVSLVKDTDSAAIRLAVSPGDGDCLLRVQVIADKNGKCGAGQLVHAMNVMSGFEETLGLVQH